MKVFHGTATCEGIAIGRIQYLNRNEQYIRQYTVESARREIQRFQKARDRAVEALKFLDSRSAKESLDAESHLFRGQIKLLEDGSFTRAIESMIYSEKVNAAYAITTTRDEIVQAFSGMEDKIIQERIQNLCDISTRLIQLIEGIAREDYASMEPFIVVANNLSPSEILEIEQDKLLGVVSKEGSEVSHTAIITKTLNLPSLIEVEVSPTWADKLAIIDGYESVMYLEPDEETLNIYQKKREEEIKEREFLRQLRNKEDVTLDGTQVKLYANIGSLEDIQSVLDNGAAGIGLLRSEFQYLGRENYPRETELFRAYRKVASTMEDKLVIIRTLDIGADKKADYMGLPEEENPAMGNRGIRICLERKKMFKAQLRAIYRASAYGNLAIMYPMITSMEEIREIKRIVKEVTDGLDQKNIPYRKVMHGIVVETPAAVMIAEELAREVDFFSLGTNDLTQYILAMDRKNPSLKERCDDHHPAVLRMIQMTVDAGHRAGRWVGICGELAGDITMTETFLRMGVDVISVVPGNILPLRKKIREIDLRI